MPKLTNLIKKVFTNREIEDQPFPEVPAHTHNGMDSLPLAPSSVGSTQIKPGAVGDLALEDMSVTEQMLADAAVATQKIKDDAITAAKVWKGGAVITLSAQIEEATIITAHIGLLQVTNSKIANAAISQAKIQDLAVGTGEIQDLAVEWAKIDNMAVGNSKIMNAAISTAKIQDLAVTAAEIADATITNAKIGMLQVGNSRIMNAAISTAKIQDLAVTNAEIGWCNAGKITAGSMAAERIYGGIIYLNSVQVNVCGSEAVNVAGNIWKTGWCSFVINHPLKPKHKLIYTGIESPEVLLVHRGSDKLINGEKKIDLPDHFQAVSDSRKITAYVTPRSDCQGLFVSEAKKTHFVVKESGGGNSNSDFDYIIFTIRKGAFDYDFEPEGELVIKEDGESEESFKQRYFNRRVEMIRESGGKDADQKVAAFTKAWENTPARQGGLYVQ